MAQTAVISCHFIVIVIIVRFFSSGQHGQVEPRRYDRGCLMGLAHAVLTHALPCNRHREICTGERPIRGQLRDLR